MAKTRDHLSVVRSNEEEHAAKQQALRQIAERVPSRMQRVYHWDSEQGDSLLTAVNRCVAEGMLVSEIEDMLDMPGLRLAYADWLGRQHS